MKKKTIFMILGGIVVAVAAIVALVFYATSGITGAADKFFEQARGGDASAAFALTSAELRNTTSPEQLAAFIEANRFDQVTETSWSSRSIENNLGKLEGSVTLADGGVIPISMELVKEADGWKVSFIELRNAGLSGGAGPQTARDEGGGDVPPDNVILNSVRFHTGLFLDSVRRREFEYFKEFWVDEITLAELEQLAAPIVGETEAIAALEDARPVVESVSPIGGGGFRVAGHLSAPPHRYDYTYAYMPDGEQWRLASFEYELREQE